MHKIVSENIDLIISSLHGAQHSPTSMASTSDSTDFLEWR
jgi:hypothetical protein